jgi:hypothetical protein
MTPIIIELGYRGLIIPAHHTRARTTCPQCSATRRKSAEPCLRVQIISDTRASLNCKHCPYRERINA